MTGGPAPAAPSPAVTDGPDGPAARTERALDAIIVGGALLCAAVGLAIMVAWWARATVVLRFGSKNPMSFNTALAFAVTGVALACKRPRVALAAGLFDAVLGATILAEYALDRNLGIDQLFAKAYIAGPHDVPGRPAINTAVGLALVGAGLLVQGPWRRRRPTALAAAGSVIGMIGGIAAFGYAIGNPTAYGWSRATTMAFLTALTMLVLSVSLLSAAWQESHTRRAGLPRWLPIPAGTTVLGLAIWLAIMGRAVAESRISQNTFTTATTVLGLILAGSAALVVWRAEGRRRVAMATVTRRAEAEKAAREGEHRLFQFLNAMPVAVIIMLPGGRPYYASDEAERLLGRGVAPDIGADELAETYRAFLAGTDQLYPTESLVIVRAPARSPITR